MNIPLVLAAHPLPWHLVSRMSATLPNIAIADANNAIIDCFSYVDADRYTKIPPAVGELRRETALFLAHALLVGVQEMEKRL